MARLMRPRSIAVLGASSDASKYSGRPLAYLRNLGYEGQVYPVNPQALEIAGYRCYPSVEDIPEVVDVAVIARPAKHILPELQLCLSKGIRAFVVFSGGFAEAGEDGAVLQQRMVDLCRQAGAVMCGPNGTGIFEVRSGAAMSFMSNLDQEITGGASVALISGSGSIATMLYQACSRVLSCVASIGNEAVTTAAEFIMDAVEQPQTSGVIVFVEAIREPDQMIKALRRADELRKPVAILKGGRTVRAAQVAATHTGAMVDDDKALQALLEHHNVICAESIEELKLLAILMHASATRSLGPGIGVLTPSGGTAVLIVDELEQHGLSLPEIGQATKDALQILIPQSSPGNPMDITGFGASSQEIFSKAIETMLADPAVQVLVVPMGGAVGAMGARRAAAVIDAWNKTDKLLIPIWQGTSRAQEGYDALLSAGLPVVTDYALLMRALGKRIVHGQRAGQPFVADWARLPAKARDLLPVGASSLNEPEVKAILSAAGIDVPAGRFLPAKEPAPVELGLAFPVVLKVASRDILHKAAVGGVALVGQALVLDKAIERMAQQLAVSAQGARIDGFLVEEMITGGLELLVGIKRDDRYGCLLTLGFGGGWTDALRGTVTALLPLDRAGMRALIRRFFLRLDDAAVEDVICNFLACLAAIADALGERLDVLEVNPVKLLGGPAPRMVALDGVLTLRQCPSMAQAQV